MLPCAEVNAILPAADHSQPDRLGVERFGPSQVANSYVGVPQLHRLGHSRTPPG